MTKKRFLLFVGNNYGVQTVDGDVILDSIGSIAEADILVEWLNNITNRNKELKHENEQLKQQVEDLEFELRTIKAYDRTVKEEHVDTVYDFQKKLEKW